MEVRIHIGPYWLPTVLSSLCPKTPTGKWCTIRVLKQDDDLCLFIHNIIFFCLLHLQGWVHILKVFGVSDYQVEFTAPDALDIISVNHLSPGAQPVTFSLKTSLCVAFFLT